MKVLVYVEGPSDRAALEVLLEPVIASGRIRGIGISFLPLNGKSPILRDVPRKAADHLAEHPDDWVFALPDLYPTSAYDGTPDAHRTFQDLARLLKARFGDRADKVGVTNRARTHFRVHCLKHDLEALLLADRDALRQRLRTSDALNGRWREPVEEQNDSKPPKRIVEELFDKYRRKPRYIDTADAPWILKRTSLASVTAACHQQFAPFVNELKVLADGQAPSDQ